MRAEAGHVVNDLVFDNDGVLSATAFLGGMLLVLPGMRETRTHAVMKEPQANAPLPP